MTTNANIPMVIPKIVKSVRVLRRNMFFIISIIFFSYVARSMEGGAVFVCALGHIGKWVQRGLSPASWLLRSLKIMPWGLVTDISFGNSATPPQLGCRWCSSLPNLSQENTLTKSECIFLEGPVGL